MSNSTFAVAFMLFMLSAIWLAILLQNWRIDPFVKAVCILVVLGLVYGNIFWLATSLG